MLRSQCKSLSIFHGIDFNRNDNRVDPIFEGVSDSLSEVLKSIFELDAVSGLPKGDIAYFLSKDGNPQVKAWLETNLLSPRGSASDKSLDGVTDDLLVEFARVDGESVSSYQSRLTKLFSEAKSNFAKLKEAQNGNR